MRKTLAELTPYRPPEETDARAQGPALSLHRNTNRLGMPPGVRRALATFLETIDLSEYPDGSAAPLRGALAARYGLEPDCFLVGNGSNEIFDLLMKALLNPGETVAFPGPTYAMYRHYALTSALRPVEVPLRDDFSLDPEALLSTEARVFVLCTPNNPTGNAFAPEAVEALLETDRIVIVDEAYAEFSAQNWLRRVKEFGNLIVVRTLSKAYGLAGLRVGYAAARPELTQQLDRARLPYNVSALSQALAQAALCDQAFVQEYVALIRRQRPQWAKALEGRGFRVWPSEANFLLAEVPPGLERDGLVEALAARGVFVRSGGAHPRLRRCVRVTVGTPQDLEALLRALDEVLARWA